MTIDATYSILFFRQAHEIWAFFFCFLLGIWWKRSFISLFFFTFFLSFPLYLFLGSSKTFLYYIRRKNKIHNLHFEKEEEQKKKSNASVKNPKNKYIPVRDTHYTKALNWRAKPNKNKRRIPKQTFLLTITVCFLSVLFSWFDAYS